MGLRVKACHQGLRPRTHLLGLEPLDALLCFPPLFACVVFLHRPVWGLFLAGLVGVVMRAIKWGRLPGYSHTLLTYLLLPPHSGVLGYERAPLYPRR